MSDRRTRILDEQNEIGAAARVVKEMLADNETPYSTFYGSLNGVRVAAIKRILEAAGIGV